MLRYRFSTAIAIAITMTGQTIAQDADLKRDRDDLRYATRSFCAWQITLHEDLDWETRLKSISAMSVFSKHGFADEAFKELTWALSHDKSSKVRLKAGQELLRNGNSSDAGLKFVLKWLLKEESAVVNEGLIKQLPSRSVEFPKVTNQGLLDLLATDDPAKLKAACDAMRQWVPDRAVEVDGELQQRRYITPGATMSTHSLKALVRASAHESKDIRRPAVEALCSLTSHQLDQNELDSATDQMVCDALIARLADDDVEVRMTVARRIPLNVGKDSHKLVAAFHKYVDEETSAYRKAIHSGRDPRRIEAEHWRGKTRDKLVIQYVIRCLGLLGEEAKESVPLLSEFSQLPRGAGTQIPNVARTAILAIDGHAGAAESLADSRRRPY